MKNLDYPETSRLIGNSYIRCSLGVSFYVCRQKEASQDTPFHRPQEAAERGLIMSMFLAVLIFVIGLALIVKGGDAFVDAATWIAKVSGIPTFIIGATIVSLATTLPEMLVSAMAAAEGSVDMACGNAIGSVTANTGMILAIAVLAMPTVVKRSDYLAKGLILTPAVSTLLLSVTPDVKMDGQCGVSRPVCYLYRG